MSHQGCNERMVTLN